MNSQKFSEALGEIKDSYLQEAIQYEKKPGARFPVKWGVLAACLAALLVTGSHFLPFPNDRTVSVYAHGTDEEITAAGAVISTGTISDSGKMRGKPLMFYLSGEGISTVRFSCKNQLLYFMDWTEKREEFGNATNFTVAYGEDESEYYYLTIDWVPNTLIRELTDNPSSTIADLPADMRADTIVLEITFADGSTATKAIEVSLLDDGTFFAAFHDYKITDADAFVRRPDSPAIPRDVLYAQGSEAVSSTADAPPMVCVDGILYRQSLQQIFYEEKKEAFRYLGTIQSDVTNDQSATDGVPKEHLQANHPVVGAEVYQYGLHIVVKINGAYWLYEAVDTGSDDRVEEDSGLSPEERMLLDPAFKGSSSGTKEGDGSADQTVGQIPGQTADPLPQNPEPSDEDSLSAAEAAASTYYAGTVMEVVSMKPISQTEDQILFSVSVKIGGVIQDPERSITLQLLQGAWEVTNEGY